MPFLDFSIEHQYPDDMAKGILLEVGLEVSSKIRLHDLALRMRTPYALGLRGF